MEEKRKIFFLSARVMGLMLIMHLLEPISPAQAVVKNFTPPRVEVVLDTTRGPITIQLHHTAAPLHVDNFIRLVGSGFYDGLYFHTVLPHTLSLAGDEQLVGRKPVDYTIPFEINTLKHVRGAVGMARQPYAGSDGTQFYITHQRWPQMDGHYTVFGHVVRGMEVLDTMQKADKIINAWISNRPSWEEYRYQSYKTVNHYTY